MPCAVRDLHAHFGICSGTQRQPYADFPPPVYSGVPSVSGKALCAARLEVAVWAAAVMAVCTARKSDSRELRQILSCARPVCDLLYPCIVKGVG